MAHHSKGRRLAVLDRDLQVGTHVYLDTKNLPTETINPTGNSPFANKRFIGPFQVLAKIGPFGFQLDVPESMRIHPVFHRSRLTETTDECFRQIDASHNVDNNQHQENTPTT